MGIMRYFIAHLPSGPIEKFHYDLVHDVALHFGLKVRAGYFPTHITIKAPFETEDTTVLKAELKKFTKSHHASTFSIHNFGHFGDNVIFLDVTLPEETSLTVTALQDTLKQLPELSWGEHEPLRHLHITVAKKDIAEKFDDIWNYLREKRAPQFDLLFDNIALLRFENDVWVVDSTYPLT